MTGTPNQVEWAERIKRQVHADFDRVAASFRSVAHKQSSRKRADTEAILGILEEKRAEVLGREQAGYFIHGWQEIGDQVRQLIFRDPRYQAIKSRRDSNLTGVKSVMNLRPLYDRLVVKRIEEKETSRIIIPDSAKEKPQEAEVMAVGRGKRLEDGSLLALEVKVGDRVLFGKYFGNETKVDGTEYLIIRGRRARHPGVRKIQWLNR
jgi:chaperonin GroES